jgi:hypothetical protein
MKLNLSSEPSMKSDLYLSLSIFCLGFRNINADSDVLQGNEEETKASAPEGSFERTLECATCNSIIGMEDPSARGWRLLKANVSLNANVPASGSDEEHWQSHPSQMIVAAQLLELIERQSARRFVVNCGQKSGLLVRESVRIEGRVSS